MVIARLLAERGGELTAIEHDADWAAWVRSQLELEDLSGVTVLHAELEPHPQSWAGAPWYSRDVVAGLPAEIDLLLVDGPPGYGDGMERSRFPALGELSDRMAADGMVLLDDADRDPEREIAERWMREHESWTFGVDAELGIALGTRR